MSDVVEKIIKKHDLDKLETVQEKVDGVLQYLFDEWWVRITEDHKFCSSSEQAGFLYPRDCLTYLTFRTGDVLKKESEEYSITDFRIKHMGVAEGDREKEHERLLENLKIDAEIPRKPSPDPERKDWERIYEKYVKGKPAEKAIEELNLFRLFGKPREKNKYDIEDIFKLGMTPHSCTSFCIMAYDILSALGVESEVINLSGGDGDHSMMRYKIYDVWKKADAKWQKHPQFFKKLRGDKREFEKFEYTPERYYIHGYYTKKKRHEEYTNPKVIRPLD